MNEQIKDGGPAFPSSYEFDSIDHIPPGEIGVSQRVAVSTPGMTLRDYFAAKVMQSLIVTFAKVAMTTGNAPTRSESAAIAYGYADAMLAARGDA